MYKTVEEYFNKKGIEITTENVYKEMFSRKLITGLDDFNDKLSERMRLLKCINEEEQKRTHHNAPQKKKKA